METCRKMETCNQCHGEGKIKHNTEPKVSLMKRIWTPNIKVNVGYLAAAFTLIPSTFFAGIAIWMYAAKFVYWLANITPNPNGSEGVVMCAILGTITGVILSALMGFQLYELWSRQERN